MAAAKKDYPKKVLRIIIALIAIVSACLYYFCVIAPITYDTARAETRYMVADIISEALYTIFLEGVRYEELVKIDKDYDGNVVMVTALPEKANQINYYLINQIKKGLEGKRDVALKIPYGTFIGNIFFAGKGKRININIDPIGAPQNEFVSSFSSGGINQTLHKIFVKSTVTVKIVLPYKTLSETVTAEVLIAEVLIAGRVPEVYINSLDWGNMLDLLP